MAKLSEDEVLKIKRCIAAGDSDADIVESYPVRQQRS
jgi:hypothetical protein